MYSGSPQRIGAVLATIWSLILRSLPRRHQAFEFLKPVLDDDHEKFVSSFAEVISPQGSNPARRISPWRFSQKLWTGLFPGAKLRLSIIHNVRAG